MSFKVFSHGDRRDVQDPQTKKWSDMTVVTYVEEGRGGANPLLAETSSYLDQIAGEKTGLSLRRTHSQLVQTDKLGKWPVHKDYGGTSDIEYPGYINRVVTSTPQMRQQAAVNVKPRMINGRLLYFVTGIGPVALEDKDETIKAEILMANNPQLFEGINFGPAIIREHVAAAPAAADLTTA